MIFEWFNAKESKAFGKSLAQFYAQRAATEADRKSKKFVERKQRELLDKLGQRVTLFKSKNRLNVYKKAQVGNSFKWHLLDVGFEPSYVDELTSWVTYKL